MLGIQQADTSEPETPDEPRRRPPSTLVDLLAIASVFALVASLFVDRVLDLDGPSTCWWRHLVHRDCLGCGLTHAFVEMRTLGVAAATAWHPLGVAVWASAVVLATWFGLEKALARRLRPHWWMRGLTLWGRVLGAALLVIGVLRLFGPVSPP